MARRGDTGQVATAVVVAAMLGAVALLVLVLLPLAGATDQRSRAQTAADAAALAHIDAQGRRVRGALADALPYRADRLEPLTGCGAGRGSAEDFARRNGARVLTEDLAGCGRRQRTVVTLEVRMLAPLPTGQRSQARARARMGFPTGSCQLSPDPQQVRDDFAASSSASQAASAAAEAADEAARKAADALRDAVNATGATPAELTALQQALDDARDKAQDALDAAQDAAGEVLDEAVPIRADCGPVELELELALPGGALRFQDVVGGDLDDLLEPRLVSTRGDGL